MGWVRHLGAQGLPLTKPGVTQLAGGPSAEVPLRKGGAQRELRAAEHDWISCEIGKQGRQVLAQGTKQLVVVQGEM